MKTQHSILLITLILCIPLIALARVTIVASPLEAPAILLMGASLLAWVIALSQVLFVLAKKPGEANKVIGIIATIVFWILVVVITAITWQ